MFESLDEKMKMDEHETSKQKVTRWTVIALIAAVLICGGLYVGLHYFQTVE